MKDILLHHYYFTAVIGTMCFTMDCSESQDTHWLLPAHALPLTALLSVPLWTLMPKGEPEQGKGAPGKGVGIFWFKDISFMIQWLVTTSV